MWIWANTQAQQALATRDLGIILLAYRHARRVSQRVVAAELGYDTTYVSMIENHRRTITDVRTLRFLARQLGLPSRYLGVTDENDGYEGMLHFGESVLRLALQARLLGKVEDAIRELWPLAARLEDYIKIHGHDVPMATLLVQARQALGISLGHILPEEQLILAIQWTGSAWTLARKLDNKQLQSRAATAYGNELRKAGRLGSAMRHLHYALALTNEGPDRARALLAIARVAGETTNKDLIAATDRELLTAISNTENHNPAFNPQVVAEVRARCLLQLGEPRQALGHIQDFNSGRAEIAPQWQVITRVTEAAVHFENDGPDYALTLFREAISAAEALNLPHQLQRIVRATNSPSLLELNNEAQNRITAMRLVRSTIAPLPETKEVESSRDATPAGWLGRVPCLIAPVA